MLKHQVLLTPEPSPTPSSETMNYLNPNQTHKSPWSSLPVARDAEYQSRGSTHLPLGRHRAPAAGQALRGHYRQTALLTEGSFRACV